MKERWTAILFLAMLSLGMLAQASDLRCLVAVHCCCSDGQLDDCQADSIPGPAAAVMACALSLVPLWELSPPLPQLAEVRRSERQASPRDPQSFQPYGLRAPPPVRT